MNENPLTELQRQLQEYSDYLAQTDEQMLRGQELIPDDMPRRLRKLLMLLNR